MKQTFLEHDVRSGIGTALCFQYEDDLKYHILSAVEELPSVFSAPNTIEYSSTTNPSITLIEGKRSVSQVDETIPYNIDNIVICDKIVGKKLKYAYIDLDDFSGHTFSATASYRINDINTTSAKTIVLTLTIYQASETITRDLYDLYQDTVAIDEFSNIVYIPAPESGKTSTKKISLSATPTTATFAVYDTKGVGTNEKITGVFSENDLTITVATGVTAGTSGMIYVKATATNYATNYRAIKVIVQ